MAIILSAEASSGHDYLVAIDLHGSDDDENYKKLNKIITTKLDGDELDTDTTWRIKSPLSKSKLHDQIVKEIRRRKLIAKSITIVIVRYSGDVFSRKTKL